MMSLLENKSSYIETLIKSELIDMNTPERILLFKKIYQIRLIR